VSSPLLYSLRSQQAVVVLALIAVLAVSQEIASQLQYLRLLAQVLLLQHQIEVLLSLSVSRECLQCTLA